MGYPFFIQRKAELMRENTYHLFRHIMKPISRFVNGKMLSSVLLLASAGAAFAWANSNFSSSYYALWEIPISFSIGGVGISDTLGHWVNNGLMAIYFFVIGLEIKREILVGELSNVQNATLPALAALGGMIVPAVLYMAFNQGEPGEAGWGIPMATDIAFSLGCLQVLGSLVPVALKIFLLALAIFDDMGAILVIALFYTNEINLISLGAGIFILLASIILNIKGVRKVYPYALLGIAFWVAFFYSGIHATIAGVLLALTIPARSLYDQETFVKESNNIIEEFPQKDFSIMMVDENQRQIMKQLQGAVDDLNTPLQKLEDKLYPLASYFILPLFALANAGVNVAQGSEGSSLLNPITIGIVVGLFIGKPLGITLFSWLSIRWGIAKLPDKTNWSQMLGAACLAGIGFTMSLFITNLAFAENIFIYEAKIAIIIGSGLSAFLGTAIFLISNSRSRAKIQKAADIMSKPAD
ncbi:MAG: Na+/H+ antiporter NhaA [Desulfotomaculaceae bacterium]|nr:Na+/H+ antiporter NhaA [Desulfotomaculaceae bacterium]